MAHQQKKHFSAIKQYRELKFENLENNITSDKLKEYSIQLNHQLI